VVYVETAVSALWVEDDTQVHRYTLIYDHLRAKALDPDASLVMLTRMAEQHS
jgi:hypothetical protein